MPPSVAPPATPGQPSRPRPTFPDPIPGIIGYGTFNILAGASGVGKTCLLSTLLTRLSKGELVFGRPTNAPTKIGFISADRGSDTARHWLRLAGFFDLVFYNFIEDPDFHPLQLRNKIKLVECLDRLIAKLNLPPGSLVIVDPVTLFFGNANDYHMCAVACIEMRRICERRQLTMIGTAHASKQRNDTKTQYKRLQDRILGSAAQLGYGDTQMYLASPEETDEKFYTFLWHPHTARPEFFMLGRDQHGLFVDWLEGVASKEEGKILACIPAAPDTVSFGDIVTTAEVSRATVHRYLQELLKEGRILKVGHGKYQKAPVN